MQAHRTEQAMPTYPLPASEPAATAPSPPAPDDLDTFYADMARLQLEGLWRLGDEVQAVRPCVAAQPYLWRGADVRRILARAGDLVRHEGAAERRTLRLVNPGLAAQHCATHTLAASVQLIRPGEVAPTHRHTPAAIRFIIQGHGAYTTIEGERCTMEPGDLVLTPRWTWHHHGNAGDEPVMWMDGLDFPLVILLNATFFQRHPDDLQSETVPADSSARLYGPALRPAWRRPSPAPRPLLTYRWGATYAALQRLASVEASPYDDVALEYADPRTGGHTLPALACWIQLLRPGVHTRAHRHTSSAVYHVLRGQGYSVIDGQRLDWAQGDFFALPSWARHEHANPSGDEAILFSITDLPTLEALDLYREEADGLPT
jgi:gentisate 1,2-dioxygenase